MNYIGDFPEDFTTVTVFFSTHDTNGAPVAPSSAFEADDVKIYKNGSATQKTSTNGLTMTSPFDSIVGFHCLVIDTSNDTGDAAFWVAGATYSVVLNPDTETVNSQTALKVLATFGLALAPSLRPTVAGRALDVSAGGEAGLDWANIGSPTTAVNLSGTNIDTDQIVASVSGAVGSVTGAVGSVTGLTASDVGAIKTKTDFLPSATAGAAGGVFIAGTNAATTVTTAFTTTFTGNLTGSVASVSGAVGSVTGLTASDVGAIKTKTDFLPSATAGAAGGVFIAGTNAATTVTTSFTTTFTGNLTGSVGSVSGAVGSVSGNIGGNVTGSVGSVAGAVASVTGNIGGNVTGTIGGLTAAALKDFFDTDSTTTYASAVAGSVVKEIADNAAGSGGPTASDIADEVQTRTIAAVTTVNGLAANSVTAAALASDAGTEIGTAVWATTTRVLTAGTNLNDLSAAGVRAAVGLASANLDTQLDALPTNAELATALGTADDAVLAAVGALSIPTANQNADALLDRADAIETGLTPRQAMRLSAAADGGKVSGGATTTNTFRNAVADDKDRIVATVTSDGDRTNIVYDLT